jgi:hypothetical protein
MTADEAKRGVAPAIMTLLLLSPLIGEVMSGATLLSYIVVLVPEVMVWGCGTLMIREAVRRWRGGWTSVLLLGLGLSIAEEFVIQQTSIAPLPWMGSNPIYGRVWGVNWPYFMFQLGFEAVWIVLVPIQVTELIFPERREEPWVSRRGLVISSVVFLIGSFIAWYSWTQMARPFAFHAPPYTPPALTVALGILAILLLVIASHAARGLGRASSARTPPAPWAVVLIALVLGFPWYGLMVVVFGGRMDLPLWIPMVSASVWGIGVFLLIGRWTTTSRWQDLHRWALSFGGLLVCMLAGFLGAVAWSRTDTIAKAVMNVIAVGCMLYLRRRIVQRSA